MKLTPQIQSVIYTNRFKTIFLENLTFSKTFFLIKNIEYFSLSIAKREHIYQTLYDVFDSFKYNLL